VENLVYIGLPLDDYRTLSGFVVGELGHLPEPGDRGFTFTFGGYGFEIVEVADMVIEKVRMYKLPKGPEDED
jgi:putative hemolysin